MRRLAAIGIAAALTAVLAVVALRGAQQRPPGGEPGRAGARVDAVLFVIGASTDP